MEEEKTKKDEECTRVCHRLNIHGAPDELSIAYLAAPLNLNYGDLRKILIEKQFTISGSETLAVYSYSESAKQTVFAVLTSDMKAAIFFELVQVAFRYHFGQGMTGHVVFDGYSAKIVLPGKRDKLFSDKCERSKP